MLLFYTKRFASLMVALKSGTKPVMIFDQDGTVTVKSDADESAMKLHPDVIPTVKSIIAKGGIYIPSSARSLDELREAYAEIPDLTFAANDGFVIARPGKPDLIFSDGDLPDYSSFQERLENYINISDIEDVTAKPMGAYFGLFIDESHPWRNECMKFFTEEMAAVSACSKDLPLKIGSHPMGITLEPKNNRGKADVINCLFPDFDTSKQELIVAGDSGNDHAAMRLCLDKGGVSILVQQGSLSFMPSIANVLAGSVEDCVEVMKLIDSLM